MGRVQVEARGDSTAAPEAVWALVADANGYARWGPWEDGGYDPAGPGPSRVGGVQWFRYDRRTTSVEEVTEVEAPRRLAYTVVRGLPVKDYRAEVILEPGPDGGTSIRWTATWRGTLLGRLIRSRLQRVYDQIMTDLVGAADRG